MGKGIEDETVENRLSGIHDDCTFCKTSIFS